MKTSISTTKLKSQTPVTEDGISGKSPIRSRYSLGPMRHMLVVVISYVAAALILKVQSHSVAPWQNAFVRSALTAGVLSYFMISNETLGRLGLTSLLKHVPRAVFHLCGQLCWMYGISNTTLSTVFAVEFSGPIWTVILAALILGESITTIKIFVIAIGLTGVCLIVGPSQLHIGGPAMILVGGAISYSLANVLLKAISNRSTAVEAAWGMALIQLPILTAYAILNWKWVELHDFLLSVAASGFFIIGQISLFKALTNFETSKVATFDLLRLPIIMLAGYAAFGEQITEMAALGALLILTANVAMHKVKS